MANNDDAFFLVTTLHGKLLRALASKMGTHFQGLQQASRVAKAAGLIDSKAARRFCIVETSFHLMRHITSVSADKCYGDLLHSLQAGSGKDLGSESGTVISTGTMEKLASIERDIAAIRNDASSDVEVMISKEVETFFKNFRGIAKVWPPIAGLNEEEARAQVCSSCEVLINPFVEKLGLNEEMIKVAKATVAYKCEKSMDAMKSFIMMNDAQKANGKAAPEQQRKNMRLKDVTQR